MKPVSPELADLLGHTQDSVELIRSISTTSCIGAGLLEAAQCRHEVIDHIERHASPSVTSQQLVARAEEISSQWNNAWIGTEHIVVAFIEWNAERNAELAPILKRLLDVASVMEIPPDP